ncbi:MAG: YDG domain-containing protein, partial [Actinomycetota bacterium]|nr:YDG domain-containing protein [Actinomycetota bacterium]
MAGRRGAGRPDHGTEHSSRLPSIPTFITTGDEVRAKDVGNEKTVTGTGFSLAGAAADNYALGSATLTTAADITANGLTVGFTAADKVYDGTAAASITDRSTSGVQAGDVVTVSGGSATFANKNVGDGKPVTASGFVLGGADGGNYSVQSVNPATANITPKSVTGSFTADDKTYDGNTSATVTGQSLNDTISGDNVSLTGGTATFATKNAGTAKTVTLTGATLTGTDAGNYTLTSVATT